jgi:hypothetical protein
MSEVGPVSFNAGDRPLAGQGILPRLPALAIPSTRTHDVTRCPRSAAAALVVLLTMVTMAGCGGDAASPTPGASARATPSSGEEGGTAVTDLSAIGCATEDPNGVGELTGTWRGNDSGVYYIRQVGECVWWFGTEVRDIQPGVTGQGGFANVASGRMVGTQLDAEWADIPLGSILNGGGLTFVYDVATDTLTLVEQRGGGQPFGGTVLTRIEPEASPDASPSASSSP